MDLVLGIDVGTSAVKAAVFDREGVLHASARASYETRYPAPGQAEQDPHDWWDAIGRASREIVGALGTQRDRISGIGIAAQMCGCVAVDAKGEPLHPCLIWLDTRSAPIAKKIAGGALRIQGYGVLRLLGWLKLANGAPNLDGRDTLSKLLWLRENVKGNIARYLDVKDWLVHRCTGRFATTPDIGQLTWLMDNRRRDWSEAYLDRFGLTRAVLPEIVEASDVAGTLTEDAATHLGLRAGLPVAGGVSDLNAAALATGDLTQGAYHLSLGTSAWCGAHSDGRKVSVTTNIATICAAQRDRYLLVAPQENAGAAVRWAATSFGFGDEAALDAEAARATPGSATPLFVPWLYGERVPVAAREGCGTLAAASLRTTRADIAYSVLAGVAFNVRWAFESARRCVAASGPEVGMVGGGARSAVWPQIVADVLARPVRVVAAPEYAGARGAAMTATVACGLFGGLDEAATIARYARRVEPNAARRPWADEAYARFVECAKRARLSAPGI